MKQINKTSDIQAKLRKAVGGEVDLDALIVYEAIALNQLPLRKNLALFKNAKAERSLLLEMALALESESRPVMIEHQRSDTPVGRVFYGEVLDGSQGSELRVLFYLDAGEGDVIRKVDNGVVDQVSVSIVPRQVLNSKSGFDYLGPESTPENVWSGTDKAGNTLGKDGVFGRLSGLQSWTELSLVGMGGAQNARILHRDQSHFSEDQHRLAANGRDLSEFVLAASIKQENELDLTQLVDQLSTAKADLSARNTEVTTLTATVAERDETITALNARIAEAAEADAQLTAKDGEIATLTASNDAAVKSLQDVAKVLLTAKGTPDAEIPTDVAELSALIEETKTNLAAVLTAGGRSVSSDTPEPKAPAALTASAFRRRK